MQMDNMDNNKVIESEVVIEPPKISNWPMILASVAFAGLNLALMYLYGKVHWNIMIQFEPELKLPEPIKQEVYSVLGFICICYQAAAVLSLVWAIWSFKGKPLWASYLAVLLAAYVTFNAFMLIT
ncbi:MAG: hypothetical protein GY869_00835 [Planctomycetes bacterium]|nr:hypothetical protein [Planctomycetota bacterium]